MKSPIVEIQNVTKDFNEDETILQVLKGITFNLYPTEIVTILGASGSGKTTLLNIVAGLDKPTSGQIFVKGKNINTISDNELSNLRCNEIGMVFQDFNLLPDLPVGENVGVPLIFTNLTLEQRSKMVFQALTKTKMIKKIDYYPDELSGGEKQRVAISRAIVNEPSLLLVDEPTGNLDSVTGQEIISLFKEIIKSPSSSSKRRAMLLTTHDANAAAIADRKLLLQDGLIQEIS